MGLGTGFGFELYWQLVSTEQLLSTVHYTGPGSQSEHHSANVRPATAAAEKSHPDFSHTLASASARLIWSDRVMRDHLTSGWALLQRAAVLPVHRSAWCDVVLPPPPVRLVPKLKGPRQAGR